ncbi:mucin-5AC-like [Astyanax mexicanus]|uniref:Mucin-5AC-like n=1 Tax=Astyanax mexicanus TaxID=7994 RepID=A0A8T2MI94_ASTMX|nr:mucin-5AC-like [Astyanax mexicanus]
MDPAEAGTLKEIFQLQGAAIGRHEDMLQQMMQQLSLLVNSRTEAATEVAAPQPPPPETPAPGRCRGFLLQCLLFFEQQPSRFPSKRSKVGFLPGRLWPGLQHCGSNYL